MLVCHRPARIQRFARIGQLIIIKSDREFISRIFRSVSGRTRRAVKEDLVLSTLLMPCRLNLGSRFSPGLETSNLLYFRSNQVAFLEKCVCGTPNSCRRSCGYDVAGLKSHCLRHVRDQIRYLEYLLRCVRVLFCHPLTDSLIFRGYGLEISSRVTIQAPSDTQCQQTFPSTSAGHMSSLISAIPANPSN